MTARHATYRSQLQRAFGFGDGANADYLARLGMRHVHTSRYLPAVPGSTRAMS